MIEKKVKKTIKNNKEKKMVMIVRNISFYKNIYDF